MVRPLKRKFLLFSHELFRLYKGNRPLVLLHLAIQTRFHANGKMPVKITQKQLAEDIGMTPSQVSHLDRWLVKWGWIARSPKAQYWYWIPEKTRKFANNPARVAAILSRNVQKMDLEVPPPMPSPEIETPD